MERLRPFPAVLLFGTFSVFTSHSQETYRGGDFPSIPSDSTQRINTASVLFDRNLNTYNWIGRVSVDTVVGSVRVGILQQYLTNVIEFQGGAVPSPPKLQSGQENLSVLLRGPTSHGFSPQVQWSSFQYSDNKGTGLNNASSETVLGGTQYVPFSWVSLTPMAGYRWDSQAGIRDRGMSYMLGARIPGFEADGYQVSGVAQYREDFLAPRKLEGDFARLSIQKTFSLYARDSLDVGVNRNRHEYYVPADSTIESRTEQLLSFTDRLDYDIDPALTSTFYVSINGRGLDKDVRNWDALVPQGPQFNTHIAEFRFDTYVQSVYRTPEGRPAAWLKLYYSERSESHSAQPPASSSPSMDSLFSQANTQEHINDNSARRTQLSGAVDVPVSFSDRFTLSGSIGILRYDTPSKQNLEDRDELLVAVTLATSHRLSRALDLGIVLDGTIDHLVYLLKERSANNNYNRVLRLSPRTIYRPAPWLYSLNAFEVLANYTVYDFEQEIPSVKSFSYRQLGWLDSTSVDFTDRIGADFFAYWKIYERGQLEWSQFRERPESSATELTYALQCRSRPTPRTLFAVGVRYFGQTRYTYTEGVRQVSSFLNSIGPTCTISWDPGPHSRILFQGWYERQRQTDGSSLSLASITMNIYVTL
jgi:hypothetical protein